VAVSGDTVLVAPGVYYEGTTFLLVMPGVSVVSEGGREQTRLVFNRVGGFSLWGSGSEEARLQGFTMQGGHVLLDGRTRVLANTFEAPFTLGGQCFMSFSTGRSSIEECEFIYGADPLYIAAANSAGDTCQVEFEHNLFIQNLGFAGQVGGLGVNQLAFRNNTGVNFSDIEATPTGPHSSIHVELVNNIFYGRDSQVWLNCIGPPSVSWDVEYNCFSGDYITTCVGPGNFAADPLFCDPWQDDFTLHTESPCIGSGQGGTNIGAFGIGCGTTTVSETSAPSSTSLHVSVAPNPVLHGATFSFDPSSQPLSLEIYDLSGRLVERLRRSGTAMWTPSEQAPRGVYFARLKGEGGSETVKFVVLR
jgi:hypothetical protein